MPDECGHFIKFPPPYKPSGTLQLHAAPSNGFPKGRLIQSAMDQTLKAPHPSQDLEKAATATSSLTGRAGSKNTSCFLHFCECISMVLSLVVFGLLIVDIIRRPNINFRTGNVNNTTGDNLTFNLTDWLIFFEVPNLSQKLWFYRNWCLAVGSRINKNDVKSVFVQLGKNGTIQWNLLKMLFWWQRKAVCSWPKYENRSWNIKQKTTKNWR